HPPPLHPHALPVVCRAHLFALPPFFFNDTPTTEIYTLSLHDALPISAAEDRRLRPAEPVDRLLGVADDEHPVEEQGLDRMFIVRSEEHTSELQSLTNLVCRLLLEKKKKSSATHVRQATPALMQPLSDP